MDVSDDEAIEATLMDRWWQLVLDCLDTEQTPFSKGTLVAFRKRLIEAQMDRRLIERASYTQEFGSRAYVQHWIVVHCGEQAESKTHTI